MPTRGVQGETPFFWVQFKKAFQEFRLAVEEGYGPEEVAILNIEVNGSGERGFLSRSDESLETAYSRFRDESFSSKNGLVDSHGESSSSSSLKRFLERVRRLKVAFGRALQLSASKAEQWLAASSELMGANEGSRYWQRAERVRDLLLEHGKTREWAGMVLEDGTELLKLIHSLVGAHVLGGTTGFLNEMWARYFRESGLSGEEIGEFEEQFFCPMGLLAVRYISVLWTKLSVFSTPAGDSEEDRHYRARYDDYSYNLNLFYSEMCLHLSGANNS